MTRKLTGFYGRARHATASAAAVIVTMAAASGIAVSAPSMAAAVAAADAATNAAIIARIAQIRAMPPAPNAAAAGAQRRELDAAWRFFGDYREDAVPLLRRELAAELRAARPSQQLLLDAAYFLVAYGGTESDRALATQAALAIQPDATLDGPQLFRLLHEVAASRDVRLLPLVDRAFLRKAVSLPLPQQGSAIDENGVRVLLYGRFGAAGERHLAAQLHDRELAKPVLDILLLTGSPDSVPAVEAMLQNADMEIFTRAVNFLLRAGGPQGRQALLALKPQGLSKEAVEFFTPIRQQLARQPAPQAGQGKVPDSEVRRQLDALEASNGSYDGVDPAAIVQSRLPKQELTERLTRIRERSCVRVTNEALSDIETTSALLNAISYR